MGRVFLTHTYETLAPAEIDAFEILLKISLPKSYRDFLLAHNGGFPNKRELSHPRSCYLQYFFAITSIDRGFSLELQIKGSRHDLPAGVIPIARTANGDQICLSLSDGKIYHWDHETQADDRPSKIEELTFLYETFDELLNHLEGEESILTFQEEKDEEILKMARLGDIQSLQAFVAKGGEINFVSASGSNLIRQAAFDGRLKFIEACVRFGADLTGKGALHAAMFASEYKIVEYLLDQGVDPNELDERGKTPLDKRPNAMETPAVKILKSRGGRATE